MLPVQQGYYWKRNIRSSYVQPAVFSLEGLAKLLARKKCQQEKNKNMFKNAPVRRYCLFGRAIEGETFTLQLFNQLSSALKYWPNF